MLIRGRLRAAGLAAVAAAGVAAGATGCTGPAVTGAQHAVSPAPRAATVVPARSPRSPQAASPGAPAAPGCQRRQLKIRIIQGGPAAGTVGADIGFTNVGSTPCRLAGSPGPDGGRPGRQGGAPAHARGLRRAGAHPAACGDDQSGCAGRGRPGWPGRTHAWRHHVPAALPPAARHAARGYPGRSHPGLDSLVRGHAGLRPAGSLTPDSRLGLALPPGRHMTTCAGVIRRPGLMHGNAGPNRLAGWWRSALND